MTLAPPSNSQELERRAEALSRWFQAQAPMLGAGPAQPVLQPVSGDASFRRYFRGWTRQRSWILMDAPPARENSESFVRIAAALATGGVAVPTVHAADLTQGFLCLDDLGDNSYWSMLDAAQRGAGGDPDADALYQDAFAQLLRIQRCSAVAAGLPDYDAAMLLRELRLFSEWFCAGLLRVPLDVTEHALVEDAFAFLVQAALAQPRVFVHRDYHSRNLMYRAGQEPGILDFQDAVRGPLSYDLVSLLKDCYIAWPREQVNAWALTYAEQARAAGLAGGLEPDSFLRGFDLMGAQRHLKVLGIFSRLWLRDGKAGYLRDMPLTLRYLLAVVGEHAALRAFADWLQIRIVPRLDEALERQAANPHSGGVPA